MRFEWFVAARYLRSPDRPPVLRLVTLFSVGGVAAGVATLVIALSMNTGFRETLQDRLLGVTAHVSLTHPGSAGIRDFEKLSKTVLTLPEVRSVTPAVYQTVLLSFAGQARGVVIKGVDPEQERRTDDALQRIVDGKFDFTQGGDGIDALLVGKQLASEWKLRPNDYVTLTSPQGRLTPFGVVPRTRRFHVTGVFDSGFYDTDENWCFMTLGAAQDLSGLDGSVNVLEMRLLQPERAGLVAPKIEKLAGPGYVAATWMEENRALFRALRMERLVTAIFVGLITFVAGLNILVVLSMTVTDKARDIAILRSLGARREQIRNIFLSQGVTIGAAGTLLGLLVGYAFSWLAGTYRLIPLDPQVYAVSYVPFHPVALDGLWIGLVAMGVAVFATIWPARAASRLLPVDILRFE